MQLWTITTANSPTDDTLPTCATCGRATFWRMGDWGKALDLTLAQIGDHVSGDLLGDAETRLANIFAELANVEHRPQVLAAIRGHPACIPYLAAYVGAANERSSASAALPPKLLKRPTAFQNPGTAARRVCRYELRHFK